MNRVFSVSIVGDNDKGPDGQEYPVISVTVNRHNSVVSETKDAVSTVVRNMRISVRKILIAIGIPVAAVAAIGVIRISDMVSAATVGAKRTCGYLEKGGDMSQDDTGALLFSRSLPAFSGFSHSDTLQGICDSCRKRFDIAVNPACAAHSITKTVAHDKGLIENIPKSLAADVIAQQGEGERCNY